MELGTTLNRFKQCLDAIPESDARANIGPRAFIVALIFSFLKDRGSRSLESIRHNVTSATGVNLARSSFWERMATRRMLHFLALLAEEAIKNMAGVSFPCAKIESLLDLLRVKGILMVDSSSMSLPKMAGAVLPGPRRNVAPAVIKWHSCFDLLKGAVKWFDLSAGTSHDQNHFPDLNLLVGMLVIFDLGYFDFCLLQAIANVGGFFLCRIKTNTVVRIGEVIEGLPKKRKGKMLFGKHLAKGKSLIEVKGLFKDGLFAWRVIGFWNPVDEIYHWYVTNLKVPAKLIYPLYRLRWQAELLFKMAKSSLRLSNISSADSNIIQSLVLAAIVATTLAQPLALVMARFNLLEGKRFQMPSLQRAGSVIVQVSNELRTFFLEGGRANMHQLKKKLRLFSDEIFDPNRKRETSIQRVFRIAEKMA